MKGRVFVVHWRPSETRKYVKKLRNEGWVVAAESQYVKRAFERIKQYNPDAVVIYLNRSPKRGREVGFILKAIKMTEKLPIVFVNGHDKVKKWTRKKVPKAVFSNSQELNKALEKYSREDN
jgi:hypothetical protein